MFYEAHTLRILYSCYQITVQENRLIEFCWYQGFNFLVTHEITQLL